MCIDVDVRLSVYAYVSLRMHVYVGMRVGVCCVCVVNAHVCDRVSRVCICIDDVRMCVRVCVNGWDCVYAYLSLRKCMCM